MSTRFVDKDYPRSVSTLLDERNGREFFVVYDEREKKFLASSVGCTLARNWVKNIKRAALFTDALQPLTVLTENGFKPKLKI